MSRLGQSASIALVGVALAACESEVDIADTTGAGGERPGTGAASGPTSGTSASGAGGAPATSSPSSGPGPTASVSSTDTVSSGMMSTTSSTSSGGPIGGGLTCADPIQIDMGLGSLSVPGTTTGGLNLPHPYEPSGSTCWNTDGPERVYAVTALEAGTLTAWLPAATTTFQSVLISAPWTSCEAVGECFDNWGTPNDHGGEMVMFRVLEQETVFLIVDGVQGDFGDYVLELDLSTGDDCSDPIPVHVEGQGPVLLRSLVTQTDDDTACLSGQNYGVEAVFEVSVTDTDTYNFFVGYGGGNPKVAYARSVCDLASSELACDEPQIDLDLGAGETVYVFYDRALPPDQPWGWLDGTIIHYY